MTKNLITAAAVAMLSVSAFAGIVTTTKPSETQIEGFTVAKEATVTLNNQEVPVSIVGAGLRIKKVAIVNVKVYVAEVLASDASKVVRTEADVLNTLDQSRTMAVRLSFVRTVGASDVQASYREALSRNKKESEPLSADLSEFLTAVDNGGDATSGKTLTIVIQKNADLTETLTYEDSNGKLNTIQGTAGFGKRVMAIWLGNTDGDKGNLSDLKKSIIKGL